MRLCAKTTKKTICHQWSDYDRKKFLGRPGSLRAHAEPPKARPVAFRWGVLELIADSGNRSPLLSVELSYGVNRIPDPTDRGMQ